VKKSLGYIFYALLLWVTALSVNYVSYSISDAAEAEREFIDLSFERAEIPVSSVKDTDVNLVSFQQRGFNDEKKNFHKSFNTPRTSVIIAELKIASTTGYFIQHNLYFSQLSPFEFLTHQFLI